MEEGQEGEEDLEKDVVSDSIYFRVRFPIAFHNCTMTYYSSFISE